MKQLPKNKDIKAITRYFCEICPICIGYREGMTSEKVYGIRP
jgi:hypothetical protein